jgi:hypothetical protein
LLGIELNLKESCLDKTRLVSLHSLLKENLGGKIRMSVSYEKETGESGRLLLGDNWKISPKQDLFDSLEAEFGQQEVKYHYDSTTLVKYYPSKRAYRPRAAVNH